MANIEQILPVVKEKAKDTGKQGAAKVKHFFGRGNNVSPQEQPQKPAYATPEFKKNFFVDRGVTTEAAVKGRRRETNERSEWVQFSEKTREGFTTFLDNYATNLHDIMQQPGGADILKSQEHSKHIYKLLSEGVSFDGTKQDDTKLKENIKKMLDKPSGWVLTKELMEQETALGLMALGLVTSEDMGKSGKLRAVGEYLGLVDKKTDFNNDPGSVMHRNIGKGTGGSIGAVVGGGVGNILSRGNADFWFNIGDTMANIPHGSVAMSTYIGAGVGAVLGSSLAEGRRNKQDAGMRGEFASHESAVLPGELKDYLKKVWKVDVDGLKSSEADVRDVMGTLAKNLKTRESYFDDLGIPKDVRDMSPESKLIGGRSVARSGEKITQKIMAVYKEKGGSTPEQYMEARKAVLGKITQEMIEGIESKPKERPLATIDQKIKDRQEGGKLYELKKNSAATIESISEAGKNISSVTEEMATFQNVKDLTAQKKQLEDDLNNLYTHITPQDRKDEIQKELFGTGGLQEKKRDTADKRAEAIDAIRNRHPIKDGETAADYWKKVGPSIDATEEIYNEQIKEVEEKINKLLQEKAQINEFEERIKDIGDQLKGYSNLIASYQSDLTSIQPLFSPGVLEDRTIDPATHLKTINSKASTGGWTKDENDENRLRLLKAIAVARASSSGTIDNNLLEIEMSTLLSQEKKKKAGLEQRLGTVNYEKEINDLTITKTLISPETQAKVFGKAGEISKQIDKYVDKDIVDPKDTISKTEKALKGEKGYYEILDLLFEYRKRPDREEYFSQISKVVTQDEVLKALQELAELADIDLSTLSNPNKLADVMDQIKANKGKVTSKHIRGMFIRLMDNSQNRALAMS